MDTKLALEVLENIEEGVEKLNMFLCDYEYDDIDVNHSYSLMINGIDAYKELIEDIEENEKPNIYLGGLLGGTVIIEGLKIDSDFLAEVFNEELGNRIDLEIGEWKLSKTAKGKKILFMWTHVFSVILIATKCLDNINDKPTAEDIVKVLNKYVENGEELPIQVRV